MSKINYDGFNANNARHITECAKRNELQRTIDKIIELAQAGEEFIFIEKLSKTTLEKLEKKGFEIMENEAISWRKIDG